MHTDVVTLDTGRYKCNLQVGRGKCGVLGGGGRGKGEMTQGTTGRKCYFCYVDARRCDPIIKFLCVLELSNWRHR